MRPRITVNLKNGATMPIIAAIILWIIGLALTVAFWSAIAFGVLTVLRHFGVV